MRGTVVDPDGARLEGVAVTSGDDKATRTGRDGTYALVTPLRDLKFQKDGYVKKAVMGNEVARAPVRVDPE